MAKFRRKGKGGTPGISTASLPDIVFMLLFFFMVSTVMREVVFKVQMKQPKADQVTKLEKKSLVSYIYVGKPLPKYRATVGSAPRIQLNDNFKSLKDIDAYINAERDARKEEERPLMTVSLKVDKETKMGIVVDIKEKLRESNALKINYSTVKGENEKK